jgi:hypothetical protein
MASTGAPEAVDILVNELQGNMKGAVLKCEEVLIRVDALGSAKRALETPKARQVLIRILQQSPCEQVRESTAGALRSVRDDPQIRSALLEASYDDAALSVRKSAVGALWHESQGYSAAYLKQLSQETDPKRQERLLNDVRSLEENWGPLPDELLQELQAIQRGLTNEKFKADISEIFSVEREQALASYERELDNRDKGYGTYPEAVRADYLDSLRVFLPSLSGREIERIQVLAQRETNPELQKALSSSLEEYRTFQQDKEQ